MKKITNIASFVLLICLGLGCSKKVAPPSAAGTKSTTDVHFIEGILLTDIIDLAKEENKPVFMHMHASWCLPCQLMDEDVYTHKPTSNFINENFVAYKVDVEKENGPDLKVLYNIDQLPGLLFLDHRGRILEQKQGAAYPTELIKMAKSALAGSLVMQ